MLYLKVYRKLLLKVKIFDISREFPGEEARPRGDFWAAEARLESTAAGRETAAAEAWLESTAAG